MNIKTPYYVIHQEELDTNYQKLVAAIESNWGKKYIIGYSYKTNALPWVISHFYKMGAFAEVVSADEYNLAKVIGVERNKIIYNGPIKTKETFVEAIEAGGIVNIDSQYELDWLSEVTNANATIGLRVNFDIEKYCPDQSQCGDEGGRFGFCYENGELEKAILQVEASGHKVAGLHLHTSSKTRSVAIYEAISIVACEVAERYKLSLDYVDVGGGFFGGLSNKPQFYDYLKTITEILSKTFNPATTTLIIEPGMCVIGSPISYVSSVIDVKETTYNRFVVTDGTRTSIDPLMTKSSYFNEFEYKCKQPKVKKQVVCGYTCMEHDRLFEAIDEPMLQVGDKIIYHKVGAYTMCLTPLFIKYFPDVYVEKNGEMLQVRNAWTPDEYIKNSIVEE